MRRPPRRGALAAAVLALLSGQAVRGAEEPARPTLERLGLAFSVADEVRYDDNILWMSDRDIRRLAANPNSSRFRVSSPDDWVDHGEFDAWWTRRLFPRRRTRFNAGFDLYRFRTNAIKNWDEYHVGMTQELTASRRHLVSLRVGGAWVSDFYLRELTDDDDSFSAGRRIRRSARYDQASPSASLSWEVVESRLTMSLGYERARRNYVHFFDERDGIRTDWSLEARVRPVRAWRIELTLAGATGTRAAKGDLPNTPIPDDDISYDHRGGSFRAAIPWGEMLRGRVEAAFEIERRQYTTSNAFDLFRFGRRDTLRERRLRVVQRLGRRLDLIAEWRHISNDAKFAPGVIPRDDVTDFDDNRYDLGLRARFGSLVDRVSSPEGGKP